uniref:Late endosomal/lysosomal adaptor and MAPK and MTOR activator 5 n=1 Tax=Peronospora matthiolae TaxID=2874970 RepID=A0AAV1V013_9STRA
MDAGALRTVHNQTGTVVLNVSGQVLSATGDLCGTSGEIVAETIYSMLQDASCVLDTSQKEELQRMIINFPTYDFVVTLDDEQVYVVKRNASGE